MMHVVSPAPASFGPVSSRGRSRQGAPAEGAPCRGRRRWLFHLHRVNIVQFGSRIVMFSCVDNLSWDPLMTSLPQEPAQAQFRVMWKIPGLHLESPGGQHDDLLLAMGQSEALAKRSPGTVVLIRQGAVLLMTRQANGQIDWTEDGLVELNRAEARRLQNGQVGN